MLDESSFSFFDSLMVFMTHYLSIESPNGIIFELEKKSSGRLSKNENLSGRVPWNRKKRTEWKKEVIDTFWLFSQCTELSIFTSKRNKFDF